MPTIGQFILDLLPPILAILIGMVTFSRLSLLFRFMLLQVLVFVVVDVYAVYVASKHANNSFIFNLGMLPEMGLLFLAGHSYFKNQLSKWLSIAGYACFLLIWCLEVYVLSGKMTLARHAYIFGGIALTAFYIIILYHYHQREAAGKHASLTLACLGIFIFFAGIVPYLAMMYFFQALDPALNKSLYQYMVVLPGHIRYILLALAFLLTRFRSFTLKSVMP